MNSDPPPAPPEYHYDAQQEALLDQYDPLHPQPQPRLAKLTRWKQLLVDPCVEFYGDLELQWELMVAKIGNPLIVKRVMYVTVVCLVFYALSFTGVFPSDSSGYIGFTDHGPFLEGLNIDFKTLEESLEYLMSVDHVSGTQGDLAVGEYIHAAFRQSAMETVQFQEMKTLLNFPEKTTVEYDGKIVDVTEQFNPLSFNGDAEGNLVYLHNGFPSDYKLIEEKNINVDGRIGIITIDDTIPISQTALLAQKRGLKGLLFVDGEGPYNSTYQRVSVAIPQNYLGDPLTPGWSSSTIPTRLKQEQTTMLKIPTVSLSRTQARPLLSKFHDKGVKFADGEFSGDGENSNLKLSNKVTYQPDHSIWNVVGRFEGKEQSDKALYIGSQRDSICANGINPNSGTSIMLQLVEILTMFSETYQWKPLRSIYFISFDASEYNFAGVTELIEAKSHEVKKEGIAYLDLSGELMNDGDQLEMLTDSLLYNLVSSYSSDFNFTVSENFQKYDNFIPFMNLGIPVIKPSYIKPSKSIYKCQSGFEDLKKMDPSYKKHSTLVKLLIRLILNITDDPLVPFNLTRHVDSLNSHMKSLASLMAQTHPDLHIDFNALVTALLKLKQVAKEFEMWENAWKNLVSDDSGIEPSLLSIHRWNWNTKLNTAEKSMLDINGDGVSKERKWFRNVLIGPQLTRPEGKDADWFSFPSIRDLIDKEGVTKEEIEEELKRVAGLILAGAKAMLE